MSSFNDYTLVKEALARQLKKIVDIEIDPKSEPKRNPFGSNWIRQRDLGRTALPVWGRVVDALAYANEYKVQLENSQTIWCTLGSLSGFQPAGARSLNTLPMGTGVYCLVHPQHFRGTIIATDPDYIADPRNHRSDYITQTSRCGPNVDAMHGEAYNLRMCGGAGNFSAGRPVDGLPVGEWGAITETGLMIFLDSFMASVRADEETGLFVFYRDQLTRLAGHNLQLRSMLREIEEWDDENEVVGVNGVSLYLKEALGAFSISVGAEPTIHKSYALEQTHYTFPEYANTEPLHDDQQPFRRFLRFDGYLGQGFHEVLCAPHVGALSSDINRYSVPRNFIGLYQQHLSAHGGWLLNSAKRLLLKKTPQIAVPKHTIRPEDINGDTATNYKAAGYHGEAGGDDHIIFDGPDRNNAEVASNPQNMIAASQILDLGAFAGNWETYHPFYYHKKDWYIPELCQTLPIQVPSFCQLRNTQLLPAPTPVNRPIDHRYAELDGVDYYPNESVFAMLEDGGIVLGDGYGAEIKITAGQIFMSAPGDIWIQPGKNLNCWAGWDAAFRAYNSFDISAAKKDVRVKAERNMLLLSGNADCGGTLIENKSTKVGYKLTNGGVPLVGEDMVINGVIINSLYNHTVVSAQKIVMTAHDASNSGKEGEGNIVLNAKESKIRLYTKYLERFLGLAAFDFFTTAETTTSANEYWSDNTLFNTPMYVKGAVNIKDTLNVQGWIRVIGGHIATTLAPVFGFQVPILDGANLTNSQNGMNLGAARADNLKTIGTQEYFKTGLDKAAEAKVVAFNYRIAAQYRVFPSNWILFENRWQQTARLGGIATSAWSEPSVTYMGVVTYPYPGLESWTGSGGAMAWRESDPELFNVATGCPVNRGTAYENATYDTIQSSALEGVYPIIMSQ